MLGYIVDIICHIFKLFTFKICKDTTHYYKDEYGYLLLLTDLLSLQTTKNNRNGYTLSMFGNTYRYDISDGKLPLLTTKHVSFKNVLLELLWFLHGKTNAKLLNEQGVKIWNGNSTREFLDSQGLHDYEEGECGPIYGHQWRKFNDEKDQIPYLVNEIKKGSRRAVLSGWNPCKLDKMCLPPCHILYIFYVDGDSNENISCHMTMRSNDTFLGLPYNIASTALLTYIIGKLTHKKPKEIVINVCDAHLYVKHIEAAKEQILNPVKEFPTVELLKDYNGDSAAEAACCREDVVKWIEELKYTDFVLHNYNSAPRISAPMIA